MNRSQDLNLKVLCNIDDEIIERNTRKRCELIAKYKKRQKSMVIKLSAAAACFALVLTAAFGGIMLKNFGNDTPILPNDNEGLIMLPAYPHHVGDSFLLHVKIDGIPQKYKNSFLEYEYFMVTVTATVLYDFFGELESGEEIDLAFRVSWEKGARVDEYVEFIKNTDEMFFYSVNGFYNFGSYKNVETNEYESLYNFCGVPSARDLIPIENGVVNYERIDAVTKIEGMDSDYSSENNFRNFQNSGYSVLQDDSVEEVYEFFNKLIEKKIIGCVKGDS